MMAAMMAVTIPGMDNFNISIHMGFWAFSYLWFSGLSDHDRRREKLTKELAVSFLKDNASSLQPHQSPTGIPAILEERGGQAIE